MYISGKHVTANRNHIAEKKTVLVISDILTQGGGEMLLKIMQTRIMVAELHQHHVKNILGH